MVLGLTVPNKCANTDRTKLRRFTLQLRASGYAKR